MSNGKFMIIVLLDGQIKKVLHKTGQYFSKPYKPFGGNVKIEVDLFNYETKAYLKRAT